ncbi:hypothetical protein [Vibrio splendidus]|uniref:hypothetical protein n=1 Tax=Vibrio splendidus TaxID=29497 RepID=UPI0011B29CBE|nr:hypothetical protein [Vibrio splendidus]
MQKQIFFLSLLLLPLSTLASSLTKSCSDISNAKAQLCVTVEQPTLQCSEDFNGQSYSSCTLDTDFSISTDYDGSGYVEATVDCFANIQYKEAGSPIWRPYPSSDQSKESLFPLGAKTSSMTLFFYFNSMQKAVNVRVTSVECSARSPIAYQ